MTESKWLACADPTPMFDTLMARGSTRKMMLFGTACCRRVVTYFRTPGGLRAVEVADRFADGQATDDEREAALAGLSDGTRRLENAYSASAPAEAAGRAVLFVLFDPPAEVHPILRATFAADNAALAVRRARRSYRRERAIQADILRDILGNPFRAVPFDPVWRTASVLGLAAGVYTDRAFDRLPILADALEDARCDATELLAHLRGDGPHVRGCWALDLVLGKG